MTEKDENDRFIYSLEELKALAKTADGMVVHTLTQKRINPHPATYVGEGKLEEIKAICVEEEIDVVIANHELSGGQIRNLQDYLEVRIIDRSQLILDIFAARAQTREGKLQVELAQYAYMLPRLRGQGTDLSRLGAGIGTRGPGETKLETDRRHIQRRMDELKYQLKSVVNQREQYRSKRRKNHLLQIAIVGYTNAGKSTIFNALTRSESLQEDKLFATLDPLTRKLRLPKGLELILTDTVGFIQDLPTSLIAAFRSTLEEVKEADVILHVIDVAAPDKEDHEETVLQQLKELEASEIPVLTIYNKKDLIDSDDFIPHSHPYYLMSARNEADLLQLKEKIEAFLSEQMQPYQCLIPESESRTLNRLKKHSIIDELVYQEVTEGYLVKGFVDQSHPIMREIKEFQQQ